MRFKLFSLLGIALLLNTFYPVFGIESTPFVQDTNTPPIQHDHDLNRQSTIKKIVGVRVETSITSTPVRIISSSLSSSSFKDDEKEKKSSLHKKATEEKPEKSIRWNKERLFPIRPPKLRITNTSNTEKIKKRLRRIGYASTLQARQTMVNSTGSSQSNINKNVTSSSDATKLSDNNDNSKDIFELSSSDQSPEWHFPRTSSLRPRNLHYHQGRGTIIRSIERGTNRTIKMPKLLLPNILRPAMYSLHGFVPRPSLNRITTTEAPSSTNPPRYMLRKKAKNSRTSVSKLRKFGTNRLETTEDAVDEIKVSGSRRRSIFAKRRGTGLSSASSSLATSASSPNGKLTINQNGPSKRRGMPGRDYPVLNSIPKTGFDCIDQRSASGVYADIETGCQVWHMCQGSRKHSFICPNGTIFNEKNGVCDWWYNVDCPKPAELQLGLELVNEKINSLKKKRRTR